AATSLGRAPSTTTIGLLLRDIASPSDPGARKRRAKAPIRCTKRRHPMEICILKFDGSHAAEDDLKEQIDAQGDRNPWLYDVGTIARTLIGRVRIGATFPDGNSTTFHEGDLTKAVGELGAYTGYYLAQLPGIHATRLGAAAKGGSAGKSVGGAVEDELFR